MANTAPVTVPPERQVSEHLNRLDGLRAHSGTSDQFWTTFLQHMAQLCAAQAALRVMRSREGEGWQMHLLWPDGDQGPGDLSQLGSRVAKIADRALASVCTMESRTFVAAQRDKRCLCALRLPPEEDKEGVLILLFPPGSPPPADSIITVLRLAVNIPLYCQLQGHLKQTGHTRQAAIDTLELISALNQNTKYLAACMTVCNQIAAEYACSRVSLGWQDKEYIRLQTMSHVERFEKKMEAVQSLESAMEEASDQDEEIVYPPDPETRSICKAHETFSRKFGGDYLLSLPLRLNQETVGVLTCERSTTAFSESEIQGLALMCDHTTRRLQDLKTHDVWVGKKVVSYLRERAASLLGVEHTLAKAGALVLSILLGVLIFGHWTYRVEAPFTLKAETLSYITAPFEGYVQDVFVETGDRVPEDSPLVALNTEEMILQEAQSLASVQRSTREAEKARAENQLADMKIALAREAQAQAKLEQIRYNIEHARVKAPFTGIVVQGEKKELLGRPVHKGDVLFKVAKLKGMYAELTVNERDIHEIEQEASGEIAFSSRPDLKFPVHVSRINPMAQPSQETNTFETRAALDQAPRRWWRPGMSGVAKIDVGQRSLLWIITHRTVDFLRMFFWW